MPLTTLTLNGVTYNTERGGIEETRPAPSVARAAPRVWTLPLVIESGAQHTALEVAMGVGQVALTLPDGTAAQVVVQSAGRGIGRYPVVRSVTVEEIV